MIEQGDNSVVPGKEIVSKSRGHKWVKGQSGNPLGRPPANDTYEACLRRCSALTDDKTGMSNRQVICQQAIRAAKRGQAWAIAFVCDRLEGKANVRIDVQKAINPLADLSDDELQQAMEWIRQRKLAEETARIPKEIPPPTDTQA